LAWMQPQKQKYGRRTGLVSKSNLKQVRCRFSSSPIYLVYGIPGIYRLYLTIPELKLAKSPKVEQKIEVLSCRRLVSQNIPSSNIDAVDCCDPHNRSNHKANQHRE
jgi:hypothetical protein